MKLIPVTSNVPSDILYCFNLNIQNSQHRPNVYHLIVPILNKIISRFSSWGSIYCIGSVDMVKYLVSHLAYHHKGSIL